MEQKIWERRQTLEEFAEAVEVFAREHGEAGMIGVRHLQRLVAGRGPGGRPLGRVRPSTARLLERILGLGVDELLASPADGEPAVQDLDGTVSDIGDVGLLGGLVGWLPDSARQVVADRLDGLDVGRVRDKRARMQDVGRSQLAGALAEYYAEGTSQHAQYGAQVCGQHVLTSVLTRPEWAALGVPLEARTDRVELEDAGPDDAVPIEHIEESGVDRLAEAAALGVRITNKPLYRLLDVDVRDGVITGRVGLAPFATYALTMDLLEGELAASLALDQPVSLPLRDRFLPNLGSVLDLRSRLCVGGVVGLTAIARPADPYRGPADYALLVQERSGQVVNAAGRLAVIPKGFHEPLTDLRGDARIGATLRREMEEELFGRLDVDSTSDLGRAAAPMHPGRLSAPMRWLLDVPGRLRTECTGFGFNLVSGNYEFAALVVIDDESFWTRFGGAIEANWESAGLRVYSSLDDHLVGKLILDESWSNEGLFAFLQGIRRLQEVADDRVKLPGVEVELGC
ncbi:MAG: transcriptional regulator [Actinophytocola sp.]|uniref:transcriptional regulator n=1 Tax=Actinophytocola sp. TaxID=1872138 RepID=UPI003C745155